MTLVCSLSRAYCQSPPSQLLCPPCRSSSPPAWGGLVWWPMAFASTWDFSPFTRAVPAIQSKVCGWFAGKAPSKLQILLFSSSPLTMNFPSQGTPKRFLVRFKSCPSLSFTASMSDNFIKLRASLWFICFHLASFKSGFLSGSSFSQPVSVHSCYPRIER